MSDALRKITEASNFYEVLGVNATSSATDVNRAYRRLAAHVHPDKVGQVGTNAFLRLTRARDVLNNPKLRRTYDQDGEEGLPANSADHEATDTILERLIASALKWTLRHYAIIFIIMALLFSFHSKASRPSVSLTSFSLTRDPHYGWVHRFTEPTHGIEFYRSHTGPVPEPILRQVVERYVSVMERRRVEIGPGAAEKERQKALREVLESLKARERSRMS